MTPTSGVGYQQSAPIVSPGGYTGQSETPVTTSNATYGSYTPAPYAYGNFDPAETFEDPSSQEAMAHLAYAEQLREQQLYHQNMAEVLQRQQQQKMQRQRQQQQQQLQLQIQANLQRQESIPPISGSTVDFYPQVPVHTSSMPLSAGSTNGPVSATTVTTANATVGTSARDTDYPFVSAPVQNMDSGTATPRSRRSISGNSPQHYPDTVAESVYSDDRHKDDLVNEIRRARMENNATPDQGGGSRYDDYKVQVPTDYTEGSNRDSLAYVPPPTRSNTKWST
ncbi:MAG: hypothetical protein J3Q66DRAFT_360319 [Benniella sp.]|nr:MAG: hypothetical protein J3Q66DRAFT_360319 [Benniella sp.]